MNQIQKTFQRLDLLIYDALMKIDLRISEKSIFRKTNNFPEIIFFHIFYIGDQNYRRFYFLQPALLYKSL